MRLLLIASVLTVVACASCKVAKDPADAPATLDQARLVMQVGGTTEVGIQGTADPFERMRIRTYGQGAVTIRGVGECPYLASGSVDRFGWYDVDTKDLPQQEACLYNVQERVGGFGAPIIGHLLIRRFLDLNVLPLKTTLAGAERVGVNWVQLQSGTRGTPLKVQLSGKTGRINVTGCGLSPTTIEYHGEEELNLTLDYLYREAGSVSRTCLFTVTANHDDALKESATILVKVYKGAGSFLDAPTFHNAIFPCFEFKDPYVSGIAVDGSWNWYKKKCITSKPPYIVEGITSKGRMFYGEHSGENWTVVK